MIALARHLKIPARYVSGFIHPDAERYRGFTQTHAWCELYFPSAGWVGFDPANSCVIGGNFVKVAIGRDFRRDVPCKPRRLPRQRHRETIDVAVKSEELPHIPPELAAERMQSLEIPRLPHRRRRPKRSRQPPGSPATAAATIATIRAQKPESRQEAAKTVREDGRRKSSSPRMKNQDARGLSHKNI